ncbi:M23 family metallopeptidase, partial [Candidatus Sumerlaeota bacterium]|nr:M23 family metallopeptidase [Candidatus Sumerlaeota bacterium]
VSLVISGCADPVADLLWPTDRSRRFWIPLIQALGLGIAGVALLGLTLYLRSVPGPDSEALRAHWPLQGRWRVVTAGRHRLTNYHSGRASNQTLAVDFVIDGPRDASLGQPVFAPISGIVVRAVSHLRLGDDPAGGNEVAIQTDEGFLVTLAHLATDSVLVSEGDRVQAGQEIAAVGNSGNADEAHLHIQAERGGIAIPILFGPERHWPLRHQIIDASP